MAKVDAEVTDTDEQARGRLAERLQETSGDGPTTDDDGRFAAAPEEVEQ